MSDTVAGRLQIGTLLLVLSLLWKPARGLPGLACPMTSRLSL